jgi:membrane-bound lytic murein transglycosylase MltF
MRLTLPKDSLPTDFPRLAARGELTAVTLYSPSSYFLYRMEPMGYEYELIRDFAAAHHLKLNIKVAENRLRLIEILLAGEADVAAYPVAFSRELKRQVIYCGREEQPVSANLVERKAPPYHTYSLHRNGGLRTEFPPRTSWIVRKDTPLLAEAINQWAAGPAGKRSAKAAAGHSSELGRRALELSAPCMRQGNISPYDSLFRKYARRLGWDWRLLAALSYQESHFRQEGIARTGAQGLMGIMPGTAGMLEIPLQELTDPDVNIRTGVEVLRIFGKGFGGIADSVERIKLTLASYNAGIGHIYDARRLAEKYGKNPSVWDGNVAEYVLRKHEPEFYNDPACRFGYLRGRETCNYVREILGRYAYYCQLQATSRTP